MSRTKRHSKYWVKAQVRLSGLKAIDPALELQDGLTVAAYQKAITDMGQMLEDYNAALSRLDQFTVAVNECERQLRAFSEKMLSAVGCRFGKSSDEYVMAGGTRRLAYRRRKFRSRSQPAETISTGTRDPEIPDSQSVAEGAGPAGLSVGASSDVNAMPPV